MSSEKQINLSTYEACLVGAWALFVTAPMYMALLFALCTAADVPTWAWVLYWAYLPSHFAQLIVAHLMRVISKAGAEKGAK